MDGYDGKALNGKEGPVTGEELFPPYVLGFSWPGRRGLVYTWCVGCGHCHFHWGWGRHRPHCELHHPGPSSLVRDRHGRPRPLIGHYYVVSATTFLRIYRARYGDN